MFAPDWVLAVVAAPLPDPTLLQPMPRRRQPWRRVWHRRLVLMVSRFLPLAPLIALLRQRPLIRLGLLSAYACQKRIDSELIQLIRWPACRSGAPRALAAMVRGMALRPGQQPHPNFTKIATTAAAALGRRDRLVPPLLAPRVQALAPASSCQLEWLENLGHCPMTRHPSCSTAPCCAGSVRPPLPRRFGRSQAL